MSSPETSSVPTAARRYLPLTPASEHYGARTRGLGLVLTVAGLITVAAVVSWLFA